eukprot:2541487-Amphidinium_carterae.1
MLNAYPQTKLSERSWHGSIQPSHTTWWKPPCLGMCSLTCTYLKKDTKRGERRPIAVGAMNELLLDSCWRMSSNLAFDIEATTCIKLPEVGGAIRRPVHTRNGPPQYCGLVFYSSSFAKGGWPNIPGIPPGWQSAG